MPADIVVIGSLNMDLVARAPRAPAAGETIQATDFRLVPGGKGANQAVAASRLGGRVAMVGRVGADGFGTALIECLQRDTVFVDYVQIDPEQPTGVALITVDASGQNRIVVFAGANGRLCPADIDEAASLVQQARLLVLQLEIPLATVRHAVKIAARGGVPVVLNPAPAIRLPLELMSDVDVLVPNETEAGILTGIRVVDVPSAEQASRLLLAQGARAVIVTLGARGALLVTGSSVDHIAAPQVDVVDTTAAGDAFLGGLSVGLVRGLDLVDAVRLGVRAGSLATTRLGAQTSLPTAAQVEHGGA